MEDNGFRLDIGGGREPRPGFINIDLLPTADIILDLERDPFPFEDGSVREVYSSHCLEHIRNYGHVLREIVRVCKDGARFTLRVPWWLSSMALCAGHVHTIAPSQIRHWVKDFTQDWFGGCKRRLRLDDTEMVPGETCHEAMELFPHMTKKQIMRLIPDACHEVIYSFTVISNT